MTKFKGAYSPTKLLVGFDNGGNIAIYCPRFAHLYDDPAQAAIDYASLLEGRALIHTWDGNEIDLFKGGLKESDYEKILKPLHVCTRLNFFCEDPENGNSFDRAEFYFFKKLDELGVARGVVL